MIRTVLTTAIALMMTTGVVAAPCKDTHGKFTKCPPPGAAAATPTAGNVTKDAKGKCHIASGPNKGKFTKCP